MARNFALKVNGERILSGDSTSMAVIFNNMTGANISDKNAYMDYLSFMGKEFQCDIEIGKSKVELIYDNKCIKSCAIGERFRIREAETLAIMHPIPQS